MHQVLRRYWAGKTDVVRLEADAAHQKKLFFLLMRAESGYQQGRKRGKEMSKDCCGDGDNLFEG
jgi:hypothetical protein